MMWEHRSWGWAPRKRRHRRHASRWSSWFPDAWLGRGSGKEEGFQSPVMPLLPPPRRPPRVFLGFDDDYWWRWCIFSCQWKGMDMTMMMMMMMNQLPPMQSCVHHHHCHCHHLDLWNSNPVYNFPCTNVNFHFLQEEAAAECVCVCVLRT